MQINNNSLSLSQAIGQTSTVDQTKVSGTGNNRPATAADTVELSSFAAQLAAGPSRLDELQAAYQSGTYNVSPSQIANGLINDALSS
jgi:anti-sigma28 factor (negative regulator of flagellin synthesis)